METLTDLLAPGVEPRPVRDGIVSVLPPEEEGAPYDAHARVYDFLIQRRLYNRFMWGVDPSAYGAFVARALASRPTGAVADVAAGSCIESAARYAACGRPVVVLDRSVAMLERGVERVKAACGALPDPVHFLQADAYRLPFRDGAFSTVLCHGAWHVFDEPERAAAEWRRVLAAGGSCFVSSLVTGRERGDRYLAWLQQRGGVAGLHAPEAFAAAVARQLPGEQHLEVQGSMAFLTVDRA